MSKEIVNKEVILEKLQEAKIELEEHISKLSEDEQGQLEDYRFRQQRKSLVR